MRRRNLLQAIGAAGLMGLASPREERAQAQAAKATRGMPAPKPWKLGKTPNLK